MSDADQSTVALCPICGHVTAASIDRFSTARETAKLAREWRARGEVVDTLTVAQVHAHGWCKGHGRPEEEIHRMVDATKATS